MNKGVFWGVSVGPGDPELLTLAAQKAILRCPVLAVPRTKGEHMLALSIAQGAADLSDKEILPLDFLMTTDPKALTENHRHLAGLVAQKLDQGLDVAMLNLGDASIYATFSYLMELLAGDYAVKVIPGVPSFCAAAAAARFPLTTMNQPLHILPAGKEGMEEQLTQPGRFVLMKSGRQLPRVQEALRQAGLYEKSVLVADCGRPGQAIYENLDDIRENPGYFTTILVKE